MKLRGPIQEAAVTGWGWRIPLGATVPEAIARLLAGERAVGRNVALAEDCPGCVLASPIPGEPRPSRHIRFLRRMGLFAIDAAGEAIEMAHGKGDDRVGLFAAVGGLRVNWDDILGALTHQREDGHGAWDRGLRDIHPFLVLRHLSNNAHALIASGLKILGEGVTFGGPTAGALALGSAIRALHDRAVDAALVVAYDSLLEPETLLALSHRQAASPAPLAELAPAYDVRASGFVPGEAAAALWLERPEESVPSALCRVATSHGADGNSDEPSSETIARVVAGLCKEDLVIDGASRARPDLDHEERKALGALLPKEAALISLSASTGNLGAATSLVQVIALAALLREGCVPPIAGFGQAPPGPLLPSRARRSTPGHSALGVGTGAPGHVGVVRVTVG